MLEGHSVPSLRVLGLLLNFHFRAFFFFGIELDSCGVELTGCHADLFSSQPSFQSQKSAALLPLLFSLDRANFGREHSVLLMRGVRSTFHGSLRDSSEWRSAACILAWTGRTSETIHQKSMTMPTNRLCPLLCAHSNPEGDAQCVEDQSNPDFRS